jgi:hypothetical protein
MNLSELVGELDLEVRSGEKNLTNSVTGGYASDLLSDVIANGEQGHLWITLQSHLNTVAVASLKEMAGIVLVNGREPEEDTVEKAETEGIPILVSKMPTFELVGRLYALGVGNPKK